MGTRRIILLVLFYLLNGLTLCLGQVTTAKPLLRPVARTFRPPIFLPPVQTTTAYQVNSSKPLWNTAVEVEDLACGKSNFCNVSLAEYDREHCFSCTIFRCQCDDMCHIYGDCCVDMAITQSPDIQPVVEKHHMECQRQFPKKNKDEKPNYIFMISRCPEITKADVTTISKCEQPDVNDYEQATPVTDIENKLIYRNSFCARCFGVELYQVWTYKIECQVGSTAEKATSKEELWRSVLNDTKCSVSNSPPSGTLPGRVCKPDARSQCNVTGLWKKYNQVTEQLCNSYYDPVEHYDDRKLYKNVFCAMCNGAVVSRKKQCFTISHSVVRPRISIHGLSRPLSVLIDFNAEPEAVPFLYNIESRCEKGTIYNPLSDSCSPLLCSRRRILSDDEMCKPLYQSSQGLGYTFSLAVTPSIEIYENSSTKLSDIYRNNLFKTLNRFQPLSVTTLLFEPYTTRDVAEEKQLLLSGLKVVGNVVSKADVSIVEMEEGLRNLDKMAATFTVNSMEIPLKTRFMTCPESDEIVKDANPIPWASVEMISPPSFGNCFDGTCLEGVEYLPAHGILDCPHIEIDLLQYNVSFNQENSSLEVFNQSVPMDSSSHYFCGTSLKICASVVYVLQELRPSNNTTTGDNRSPVIEDDLPLTIVSIVCITLSLICLLLTFIIYCIIPQLRTLPGKNTMALIFHLFCAQLFFQVGIQLTYNTDLCRAMGVIIHYFWLTAFGWMAVSAYHMCAVFSNLAASRFGNKSGERRTLLRYTILCNVFAIVFVLSCVIYHLVTTKGSGMGYGGHICFLNEPVDIGIFFAVPLGLVLVFNIMCFIRTVVSIRSVPDMKSAKNKPNRNHMHVYFRLSILLGFTWVFGFVAAVVRLNVMWYIFIILNGLQGVFIFVAYCLNKRTLRQLKSRLCGKGGIKYSRPSKSSSSDRTTHSSSV